MTATSYAGDSPLFLIDYLLRLLRVIVLVSVWHMLFADKGEVSGMTLPAVLTYTLIAEVFAEQLAVRTDLENALWDGSVAMHFLQPLGLFGQFAAELFGRWVFGFCVFSLPLLVLAPLFGVSALPASVVAGVAFLLSLMLAISVGLALDFILGALMLYLEHSIYAAIRVRMAITTLLSGAVLPLALLPWGLGAIFEWLPFAAMASAPLRIYTGTGEPVRLLVLQLGWSIVLWPIAYWQWQANREKMVSFGG